LIDSLSWLQRLCTCGCPPEGKRGCCKACSNSPLSFTATVSGSSEEAINDIEVALVKDEGLDCSWTGTYEADGVIYTYTIIASITGNIGDAGNDSTCEAVLDLSVSGDNSYYDSFTGNNIGYQCCCSRGLVNSDPERNGEAVVKGCCEAPKYVILSAEGWDSSGVLCNNVNFPRVYTCTNCSETVSNPWSGVMAGTSAGCGTYTLTGQNWTTNCLTSAEITNNGDGFMKLSLGGGIWVGYKAIGDCDLGDCDTKTGDDFTGAYSHSPADSSCDVIANPGAPIKDLGHIYVLEICPECVLGLCRECDACSSTTEGCGNPDDKYVAESASVTATVPTIIRTKTYIDLCDADPPDEPIYCTGILEITGGSFDLPQTSGCSYTGVGAIGISIRVDPNNDPDCCEPDAEQLSTADLLVTRQDCKWLISIDASPLFSVTWVTDGEGNCCAGGSAAAPNAFSFPTYAGGGDPGGASVSL
jgi:hypothetical protein